MPHRRRDLLILALIAIVVRIPAFLATKHLSFDDGVYAASAIAMRHGGVPFRTVFSSQGPLFLPLVFLGDLIGLRTLDAPRLLAVASGVALTLLAYVIATQVIGNDSPESIRRGRCAGWIAGLLVALTGSVLWTTGPLTSDGPGEALAAACVAVALWYRKSPNWYRIITVGVLAGAAVSVKSLLAGPAVLAAWLVVISAKRLWQWLSVPVIAGLVTVLCAIPFGWHKVLDQSVLYHTEHAGKRHPLANVSKIISTLTDHDFVIVVLLVVVLIGFVAPFAWRKTRPALNLIQGHPGLDPGSTYEALDSGLRRNDDMRAVPYHYVYLWVIFALLVLILETPMWRNHLVHLVVPLAILVAVLIMATRPSIRIVAVALLIIAIPYQLIHVWPVLHPTPYRGDTAALEQQLRSLPKHAQIISDDPGLVWRAGHRTPDNFVDTSSLRITSAKRSLRITANTIAQSADTKPVCAVVIWSTRFGNMHTLPALLTAAGYNQTEMYRTNHELWVKLDCSA